MSNGCVNRPKAIAAGAKLPPTALDLEKTKKKNGDGDLTTHFARVEKFNNTILNQIIVLWLLRQAIPWNRVEDPYLKAAFNYCEPAAILFKRKWAATGARKAYLELQEAMLHRLKVSSLFPIIMQKDLLTFFILYPQAANSKFCLIHDVWTTKGNRYGFIGVSVSFIDNDWNYTVLHLSIKLVSWLHQGRYLAEPIINILKKHQLSNKISHLNC
jgi:hypothetical protein